jgi:hypothetical protein
MVSLLNFYPSIFSLALSNTLLQLYDAISVNWSIEKSKPKNLVRSFQYSLNDSTYLSAVETDTRISVLLLFSRLPVSLASEAWQAT